MPFPKILIFTGIGLIALGGIWGVGQQLGLGRLPGDISIRGKNGSFYFPIVSCFLVSVVLTVLLNLGRYLKK